MKQIHYFCDICRKKVDYSTDLFDLYIQGSVSSRTEFKVCYKCLRKVRTFVNVLISRGECK